MLNTISRYINDNYGSRRGLLVFATFYFLHRIGYREELKDIDFSRIKKLVFVCSGNICRSPIAESYAQHLGLTAESYGLHCRGGDSADPRAVEFGEKAGFDVSSHASRNISEYKPGNEDLVVAMEPNQIHALAPIVESGAQITLAPLWLRRPRLYIHDPFGSNPAFFDRCGNDLIEVLDRLKERLDD